MSATALAAFMHRELPIGSRGTGRYRYWWARKGNGSYVYLGVGDLGPDQANRLIEQFCRTEIFTVVASPVQQLPSGPQDLTERHTVLCAAGYHCVRSEPMKLACGAIGDIATNIWQLMTQ